MGGLLSKMASERIKLGKLEINLDELESFIIEAKVASSFQFKPIGVPVRIEFSKGDFMFITNLNGYYKYAGTEEVRWKKPSSQLIWQMNYFGGMVNRYVGNKERTERTYNFLKQVLSKVDPDIPFRGPNHLASEDGSLEYSCSTQGFNTIQSFEGDEKIDGLYTLEYHGGLIIPK